ncbi:MAG TPA: ATP-binding cassette domain-containing protein, partial [Hydrogenobaculum sp.]|nr:ATP-binding cassette domain-containing protein [Hydrogenobaculum sp.]
IKIPYSEKLIVKDLNLTIEKKEHTIIMGPSGVGKSTLIRAIAGIWPFGEGTIKLPPNHMFLPQKPYFPYGSLREILLYPSTDGKSIPNEYLEELLDMVGLSYLSKDLNTKNLWSQVLSPGEQQSLNIARVLLHSPDWLFMDESTSALNEEKEIHLYRLLLEKLKNLTIISVAHRKSLEDFHIKKLILKENAQYEITYIQKSLKSI